MIGKVAKCRKGMVGLVSSVHWGRGYSSGGKPLCKGACLDPGRVGQAWQSIDPEWIGTLDEWVKLRYAEIVEAERAATSAVIAKHGSFSTPSRRNLLT